MRAYYTFPVILLFRLIRVQGELYYARRDIVLSVPLFPKNVIRRNSPEQIRRSLKFFSSYKHDAGTAFIYFSFAHAATRLLDM